MRVLLVPVRVLVGLGALVLTVPFVLLSMPLVLGGVGTGDWMIEHAPLNLWLDYLERRRGQL